MFEAVSKALKVASSPGGATMLKHAFSMDLKSAKIPRISRSASFNHIDASKNGNNTLEPAKWHRYSMEQAQHTWKISAGLWSAAPSKDMDNPAKAGKERSLEDKEKPLVNAPEHARRSESSLTSTTEGDTTQEDLCMPPYTDFMSPRSHLTGKQQLNEKIVSLSSAATEVVFALGLEERLVGVTNLCGYPSGIEKGRTLVARTRFDTSRLDKGRLEMKLKDFWCRKETAFVINEEFLRSVQPGLVLVEEGGDPDRETVEKVGRTLESLYQGICGLWPMPSFEVPF